MSASTHIREDIIQEQILQAARQLFQQHGLHKVTMDDVAKAIGKGRSSLYYYYKSKDEIFDAVMDAEIAAILAQVTKAVEQASSLEEKIRAFFVTKLLMLRSRTRKSYFNMMDAGMDAEGMSAYTKARDAVHGRIMKQEGTLLSQIITGGMESGELRAMDQKDLDALIFVLLSSLHGLKREMVIEGDFSRIEPAVDTLTNLILHGLKA